MKLLFKLLFCLILLSASVGLIYIQFFWLVRVPGTPSRGRGIFLLLAGVCIYGAYRIFKKNPNPDKQSFEEYIQAGGDKELVNKIKKQIESR
jgi:hypothetical protein